MRDEKTAAIIHDKAAEIMQRIQQGRLFGEPVDLLDPDEIVYAAYLAGRNDEMTPQSITGDRLRSMFLSNKP